MLRRIAAHVHDQIKEIRDVSEVKIIGGERRQVRVILDKPRMTGNPQRIIPGLRILHPGQPGEWGGEEIAIPHLSKAN